MTICVTNFHKNYGETIAVSGLSFDAAAGTVLGMLGPNGAGKTTTLRTIAGILRPTHGSLSVAGHDVIADPINAKRNVAYVPDDPKLFDALTVWEHLDFMASVYQVPDFAPLAEQLLVRFELVEKRNTVAGELSRGMRQKVALCCAYLHDPKAILLDEPMTGLDPHGIRTLKDSIRHRASQGATLVISSHLLSLIEDLCTHLLIMVQGRSLFFGTIDAAQQKYPNLEGDTSLERIFFRATEESHGHEQRADQTV